MPSTHGKTPYPNSSPSGSGARFDYYLARGLLGLGALLGLLIFVLCGGLWLVAFLVFATVLAAWGESHILPWMFFLSVVSGLIWLLATLAGIPL